MSEQHLRTRRTYPIRSTAPRSLTTTPATTTTPPFQQGTSRGIRSRPGRGPDSKPTTGTLSTRGDKDGDLSMADSTIVAPGAPRFKPYGRPKRQLNRNPKNDGSPPSQQAVQVVITGHKGGSYENFLDFISQKTISPVVIFENPKHEGSKTTIRVKNYEQAEVLVNLGRKGLTFAGNKVIIRHAGIVRPVSISSGSTSTIDAIKTYLLKRYQKERRYLDLEGMATDQELLRAGIRFGNAPPGSQGSQVGAVVIKLASELFPEVETVSVAGNRLRNLHSLASLPSRLPNLKNLSLTGNLISNFRELEPLSGPAGSPKFKNLRELLLANNPLVENEFKRTGDYINYRSEITRRFPSLELLDQVPLAPSVQFDIGADAVTSAPGKLKIPVPIKSGFFDAQVTQEMATNFVKTYLNAYDNDRGRLLDAYDPRAIFSISICTAGGSQQSSNAVGNRRYGGRTSLDWSGYTKYDRNLSRVKDLSRRLQTLHVGNTNVLSAITSLPATSHSKVLNEPDRLCIDAWQQHGIAEPTGAPPIQGGHPAMFVNVHGEFVDQPSKTTRSFDRIFTLGPSVAGSPAQLAGWPVVILSDNLTLRPYSGYDAWQPETTTINPLTSVPAVVGVPETATAQPLAAQEEQRPEGVNEAQHRLAIELGRVTGLKYGFSVQCLSENAWNYANALTRFNDLKAQGVIPPGAFAM